MLCQLFLVIVLPLPHQRPLFPHGVWYLHVITQDRVGPVINLPPRIDASLELADSSYSGFSGCNGFRGSCTIRKDSLFLGVSAGTKKYCPGVRSEVEDLLDRKLFGGAARFYTVRDTLVIEAASRYSFRFCRAAVTSE